MACLTSIKTNTLWNGERLTFFEPEREIRQGDPMSPYNFMHDIDKLSHLITLPVDEGSWKLMKVRRNGPQVSYLMFKNDLFLFTQISFVSAIVLDHLSKLVG